jgi:methyl-accepting chemotaxis protein
MLDGSREVIRESENLEKTSGELLRKMENMALEAGQITAAVNNVNDISYETKEHIEAIFGEVSKFKLD